MGNETWPMMHHLTWIIPLMSRCFQLCYICSLLYHIGSSRLKSAHLYCLDHEDALSCRHPRVRPTNQESRDRSVAHRLDREDVMEEASYGRRHMYAIRLTSELCSTCCLTGGRSWNGKLKLSFTALTRQTHSKGKMRRKSKPPSCRSALDNWHFMYLIWLLFVIVATGSSWIVWVSDSLHRPFD